MRKFARLSQPPEPVRELFWDVLNWPHWFPGIRSSRVLDEVGDLRTVELVQDVFGKEWFQRLEFETTPNGFRQRLLKGKLKRWDAEWRFLPTPDGSGTTFSLSLEIDLGILGRLTPSRVVQQAMDRLFRDVVVSARDRLRELETEPTESEEASALLAVFSTPAGLELMVSGRRYRLVPID